MVVSQSAIASDVGGAVLREGGNAVDAAVATAFALAVTHPTAGNIGGGGFLVLRLGSGEAVTYDFRETAPARASPTMFLRTGSTTSISTTTATCRSAFRAPWPACTWRGRTTARCRGSVWSSRLSGSRATDSPCRWVSRDRSLGILDEMKKYPASLAQFSKNGTPYAAGDVLKQPDLARSLDRIATQGPAGFYEGETARLIEQEMRAQRRHHHARGS